MDALGDESPRANPRAQGHVTECAPSLPDPGPGEPGHALRGVSVLYVMTTLLEEAAESGDNIDVRTFEPLIRRKGAEAICPRDMRKGAAYVDCLSDKDAGPSSIMLSYTWSYKLSEIADGLQQFCQANYLAPEDIYVWICCLCINQHRVQEQHLQGKQISFEQFEQDFGGRVEKIGHVVALMSPWEHPLYITRCWCLFELFKGIVTGCTIDITMPNEQGLSMHKALLSGNLDKLWQALGDLHSQDAQAFSQVDRENIMQAIQNGPGFCQLDNKLSQFVKNWVVQTCIVKWEQQRKSIDSPSESLADLGLGLGVLLRAHGDLVQAQKVLAKTKAIRLKTGTLQTQAGARLLKTYGAVIGEQGDLDGELEEWAEAIQIHHILGTLHTTVDGAVLLRGTADVHRQKGQFDEAMRLALQAKDTMVRIEVLETTADGAKVLRSLGNIKRDLGCLGEALEAYEQSKSVRIACDLYNTPDGAQLLTDIAAVELRQDRVEAALAAFAEAEQMHEKMATMETSSGALLLMRIGDAKRQQGDQESALCMYEKAKKIYMQVGTLDSKNGATLLQRIQELA